MWGIKATLRERVVAAQRDLDGLAVLCDTHAARHEKFVKVVILLAEDFKDAVNGWASLTS